MMNIYVYTMNKYTSPKEVRFVAGNGNSGGIIAFKLSEKEFDKKIEEYKSGVYDGTVPTPCPSDFYTFLGYSTEDMRELIGYRDNATSAYSNRAKAAKKMLDWCKNQLVTHPAWSGKNLTKAIFLLKQDWGDGQTYRDQDAKATGPAQVNIKFGGDDKRAARARK